MRLVLALGLLSLGTLPLQLHAQESEIPAHPRDLRFAEARVELPTAQSRRYRLDSGVTLYLAVDHTLPLVEISVAMRGGSSRDSEEKTGLAYLTATQIRRGGAAKMDADSFDNRADDLGARLDTVSGVNRDGARLSVPSWGLDEGLDLFFAMLTRPGFQKDRLAVSRENLMESLSRRNEEPLEILDREWSWLMYGENHSQSRAMTSASLEAIDHHDLIDDHALHWRPENMIVAISGDFDEKDLLADLERRFETWPPPDQPTEASIWPPPPPPASKASGLYHYEMDIPQAKVILGHRFPELLDWSDEDRFALAVVAEILGGQGAVSRIAGRLRTAEALVYRTSTELYPGEFWAGELKIFFETQGTSVARSTELALAEVNRLRTEEVHPMELAVVKASLLARLRLQFDTAEEIAGYFAEDELMGRPHTYWQRYADNIAKVTVSDVQRVAEKYLQPKSMLFLVIGRWAEISGSAPPNTSPLSVVTSHPRSSLPPRDPLTLEVVATD